MEMNNRVKLIGDYLDSLFPNPKTELVFHSDYELLIAIMLSAQTTDKRVNEVTKVLFSKYCLEDLCNANIDDLENILRPLGSFRKKAIYTRDIARTLISVYNGVVPKDKELLVKFPGVGVKTANVFLSEFYGYPAIAVDTHVERVAKRLRLAYMNDDVLKVESKLESKFSKNEWSRRHLQFLLFGRYYCKAINPKCSGCCLSNICRYFNDLKK